MKRIIHKYLRFLRKTNFILNSVIETGEIPIRYHFVIPRDTRQGTYKRMKATFKLKDKFKGQREKTVSILDDIIRKSAKINEHLSDNAASSLGELGIEGQKGLERLLYGEGIEKSDNHKYIRHSAAWGLAMGCRHISIQNELLLKKQRNLLLRSLSDQQVNVRWVATGFAAPFADKFPTVLNALIKNLYDTDRDVRWQALLSIMKLKSRPTPAVEALSHVAENEFDSQLGAQALITLAEWEYPTEFVLNILEKVFNDRAKSYVPIWQAARAIIALGENAPKARHLAPRLAYEWYVIDEEYGPIHIYGSDEFSYTCMEALSAMGSDGKQVLQKTYDASTDSIERSAINNTLQRLDRSTCNLSP